MKTWAGYVRVSFVGRRGGDSFHSPDDQAREIQRWASDRGVSVEMLPPDLDGKSNDWNRPILNRALDGVKAGKYAGVVVAKQDRLAREVPLMHDLLARVQAAGGHLAFADGDVDTTTPDGMMWFNIKASIDQRVRDQHVVEFRKQRSAATERGIWQNRRHPKGYTRDPATRRLVPTSEAGLVVRAFEARARGAALVQVADLLAMTPSGARALLANRVYLGELHVGPFSNLAAHPPIVGRDLFDQVQQTKTSRPPRAAREIALLIGLVRCCGCGHLMSRTQTKAEVYGCAVRHSAGRCPEPAAITTRRLDEHLTAIALDQLRAMQASPIDDGSALRAARSAARDAETDLRNFLEAVTEAGIDPADFAAAARKRQERLAAARRHVDELASSAAVRFDGDPVTVWDGLEMRERNHLLRGLVETVLVRAAGRGKIVAIEDRVRVIAAGSGMTFAVKNGSDPLPVRAVVFPERDDPGVLRVPGVHDAL